jgi:hypothetical protein
LLFHATKIAAPVGVPDRNSTLRSTCRRQPAGRRSVSS